MQPRQAYWGTNGDEADWLALGGSTEMCRFQTDDEAKSRIYVDLVTLTSKEPTLAGLAYLAQVPMPSVTGGANPATGYCSKELGGSSTFGAIGAAGGGWVAKDDPDDVVVALCVFPDQSFIDEWGLAYHSNGEIRGKDLTTVMQYQTAELPPVFPREPTAGVPIPPGHPELPGPPTAAAVRFKPHRRPSHRRPEPGAGRMMLADQPGHRSKNQVRQPV